MNGNEYQFSAMRTNDGKSSQRLTDTLDNHDWREEDIGGVLHACLGLSGEVGEVNDMIKKWIFHEKNLDTTHLQKELGDVMWYIALFCDAFGWDLNDILQMNIDKLKARYPEGFDTYRANNRKEGDV